MVNKSKDTLLQTGVDTEFISFILLLLLSTLSACLSWPFLLLYGYYIDIHNCASNLQKTFELPAQRPPILLGKVYCTALKTTMYFTILYYQRGAGNAIINAQSKTASAIFSSWNEPIGVTLLRYVGVTIKKAWQLGDTCWYIGCR